MFYPRPQPAGIAYMTWVAPPALTGTAISLMATVTWVVGKAVKSWAWYYYVFNADDLNDNDDEDDNHDYDGDHDQVITGGFTSLWIAEQPFWDSSNVSHGLFL